MHEARDAQKQLTAFDIGCIVISGILGVGIFFTPNKVALAVDSPAHALVAWGIGGAIALCGAFVFAALALRVPGHGGTFAFVHAAFGRLPAFLYGWANWLVSQSVPWWDRRRDGRLRACCSSAGAGSGNLRAIVTILAILAFTATNAAGLRLGSGAGTLTVLKTGAVFLLVLLGFVVTADWSRGRRIRAVTERERAGRATRPPRGSLRGDAARAFSYGGWQQDSFVAGVARSARSVSIGIVAA